MTQPKNQRPTRTEESASLEPDQVRRIAFELDEEFAEDPHYRVARKLRAAGFTESHVRRFRKTTNGQTIPEDETTGVENALNNLEKGLSPRLPWRGRP